MKLTVEECYMVLEHRYKNATIRSIEDAEGLLETAKMFAELVEEYLEQAKEVLK